MENNETAPNNKSNKKIIFIVLLIVMLMVSAGVYSYIRHTKYFITTDDAYVSGRVHTISSKVTGTVKNIYVQDNQGVKKGDILLEIDSSDYDVKVGDAEAGLNVEKSKQKELFTRIDVANKQLSEILSRIDAAKANLRLQEANVKQAKQDLDRAQKLFDNDVLPEEKLERAKTGYDVTLAQLDAANEQMKQALAAFETQKVVIQQAKAAYQSQVYVFEQKQQVLAAENLKKGYTKIYSPGDGYVTRKSVEIGNQIQTGQTLMAVVALDDVWVIANYKETQLENVRPGQKVKIKVDTYSGKTFSGKVDSIMAGTGSVFSLFPPENATGNYVKVVQRIPVKIVLDKDTDPEHLLRVGMSVIPTIAVRQ